MTAGLQASPKGSSPTIHSRLTRLRPFGSVDEIYFQMFHGHPLYNISGAGTSDTREDAIRILSRYVTDPNSPSILADRHVHYVFVHDDVYAEQQEPVPSLPAANFQLVKRFRASVSSFCGQR